MDLWIIFITGLTVGGLTCLAVQGGLLASVIAAQEKEEAEPERGLFEPEPQSRRPEPRRRIEKGVNTKNPLLPTAAFLLAKLVAYTALGFVLGAFGGALNISQEVQIGMQLLAGVYMIAVALNLLNVHPIFRYAIIQPPKFLAKKIRSQSKSKHIFAPAMLGALTVFIPCGTTLAMEVLAISSASAINGALIMATFVLGTTPLFFGLGWVTSVLGDTFRASFLKVAALALLYLGAVSVNGALVASGLPGIKLSTSQPATSAETQAGKQRIVIDVTASGYSPQNITVKKSQPVVLTLRSKNAYSCASAFRIPAFGVARNVQPNGIETVEFTPTKTGPILFTCSMGMYSGTITVL